MIDWKRAWQATCTTLQGFGLIVAGSTAAFVAIYGLARAVDWLVCATLYDGAQVLDRIGYDFALTTLALCLIAAIVSEYRRLGQLAEKRREIERGFQQTCDRVRDMLQGKGW